MWNQLSMPQSLPMRPRREDEKARRVFGEGVDKCGKSHSIGSVSERLGASFYVEDVQGELHVDRGPYSKAQECSPLIGRLERGAMSGKEVVCAFNDQATFSKTLEFRRDLKNFDKLEEEEEVRRPEIPTTKESGRNVSPGGLSAGLGTGAEDVLEGGGNIVSSKGRLRVWLGKSEENIP
ncbi:hypothetical protein ACSQ67_000648 [Phaseolus vulgaris]